MIGNQNSTTGYLDVPLHVLYKHEYNESIYTDSLQNNSATKILSNCKVVIFKVFIKLKDFLCSTFGPKFQQEIILNNVDCKTKDSLMCYIKSLNLKVKEYYDPDGTKVIEVDIAPIKNKPELNDLIVYIENEKIKISRKEIKGSAELSTSGKWSTERNIENFGARTSLRHKINISPSVQIKMTRQKIKESFKKFELETKNLSFSNEIFKFDTFQKINENKDSKFEIKEDPLTRAEKKIKSKIISRSKTQKSNRSTDKLETTSTDIKDMSNKDMDKKIRSGLMSSLINLKTVNDSGVFWNAEKIKYNNIDVHMIVRADDIKEKSINIIKQLNDFKKIEGTLNKETEKNIFSNDIKNSDLEINKIELSMHCKNNEDKLTNKEIKNYIKSNVPLIELKNNEPYMINGITSDPNFKPENDEINELFLQRTDSMDVNVDEDENKNKKKRKFGKFIKKLFKKKKRSKTDKEIRISQKKICLLNEENTNKKNVKNKNIILNDIKYVKMKDTETNNLKVDNKASNSVSKFTNIDNKANVAKSKNNLTIDDNNEDIVKNLNNNIILNKEKLNIELKSKDSKTKNVDIINNNLKTKSNKNKDLDPSIFQSQTNKELSFNWKNSYMGSRIDKNKKLSVIKKLYNKLKINSKDVSDSELTTSSETLDVNKKNNYQELSWSTLESHNGTRRSSVDTVQSITNTVIKRLAKQPKRKRK